MEDLIRRQDAIEAVTKSKLMTAGTMLDCKRRIEGLPSAEPKTGRWILAGEQWQEDVDNDNYHFICSECGKIDVHSKAVIVSYCWNCGARMLGGGDEV